MRVCLPFDLSGDNVQKTVTDLLDEWQAMGQLYQLVTDFADSYNGVCVLCVLCVCVCVVCVCVLCVCVLCVCVLCVRVLSLIHI